jgi:fumarate reductase subunit D
MVHSLTDFNLHIPANALLFSVIAALTAVMAFHRKS